MAKWFKVCSLVYCEYADLLIDQDKQKNNLHNWLAAESSHLIHPCWCTWLIKAMLLPQ